MNRDLLDYQEQYANQPYEKYQVAFRKRKLIELLQKYDHKELLEVGCGLESIFLDFNSYKNITVIEPAEMFYDKAIADKERALNKNITVIKALLEDTLPQLKGKKFDFILVSSLLHEIPDQPKFFKTLYEIASEGTVIHLNVPNAKSFHRLLAVEMGLIKSEFQKSDSNIQFQQHTVFDIDLLKETAENNGFEVIESGSYSFKPFTHQQMQNMINNNSITEQMLDGFYKMERYLPNVGSEIFVNIKKK
jgi:ubiquinone/menaquinone biosynthesis C-methylase UbiE